MQSAKLTIASTIQRIIAHVTKKLSITAGILLLCIYQAVAQPQILGKWFDVDHEEKKIEMYVNSDNKINGRNEKNVIVFKILTYDLTTKTYKGILINPDGKEEFEITIYLTTDNRFSFSVKKLIFTKKFTFERQSGTK